MRSCTALVATAFLALALPAIPAIAADWERYVNDRFGYTIDIPPGFAGMGESDSGDGQVFRGGLGTQVLTVFGGTVTEGTFEDEVAWRKSRAADDGLTTTYEASTPSWASWSGKRGDRIVYDRMIALCDGNGYALFDLEYFAVDMAEVDPLIDRLVRSLRSSGAGLGC